MKKLYIIEVDESEIVECWNEQATKELGYQEYALKQCPEIKVKPYNPTGDLMSRSVAINLLNEAQAEFDEYYKGLGKAKTIIDNAPPVDIKDQIAGAYNEGYMCGNKEAEKARPQGKWELNGMIYYCSECGHDCGESGDNFCGNCGADMRPKGGAK